MKKMSRAALVGAAAVSSVVLVSAPAFAHVSVQPEGEAAKGDYAVVDFKVPNERDDAATTKVEVNFPTEHPLASVMPEPVPGWKADVTKTKLDKPMEMHGEKITEAVSKVTWTATGSGKDKGVQPGYFQKFPVSIGQLPTDSDQLVFKAIQTYDNKEVVRWIEPQQKGQEEPENPAPTLELSAAKDDGHGASGASDDGAEKETAAATTDSGGSSSDTTARALGIVGIVVGAAGVAFGVMAGRRRTNS
ncbi:YcnI family protein [Streptomyces sp. NBC_00006]|uniref:YcnI family copper-binding membrane protein n=1 Tax=unclassified Streptomyces TaxID=2593676 RepID=UPI00224ECDC6|nr:MULTISPECIES: YcnI family protein [unclassified Streptomyces]MCX4828192.1 YcnI family protein [Streptomyces sp. NBC_01016]MCX5532453.1 YcnI family protein [Streptomyces sp. NBC_00006]